MKLRYLVACAVFVAQAVPAALDAAPDDARTAAPAASAAVRPSPKWSLSTDVPGTDKSPVPTAKEWLGAGTVELTRRSPSAVGCVATLIREWVRVRCPVRTFAISLLGGSNEGLAFWIGPEEQGQPGEVQFPLRRGDRRVVQLWTYGQDAEGGVVAKPGLVLQEQWVEGDVSPTITVL